ncbi:hypothetical protein GGI10_000906 [Coemansia sp. RSA 2530]|nr:hypothetical protein GGI10_000906 [Coemansia sp. RSA 2530]
MRTDQTEQSTALVEEDEQLNDLEPALDSDQEEEPPKYTVIPLPLSLRAQAYLQCHPQQRHGDQGKVPTEQQSLVSRGGSSNALILYNPGTHEPIDRTDDCVASGPVPCITGLSPGSSTSSMDVD